MAARRDDSVIIEVALNGGTQKDRNPLVPIKVEELISDALACIDAGAQIIHQHDDMGNAGMLGGATPAEMAELSLAVYRPVLKQYPDAILYPTANWGGSIVDRWGHNQILASHGVLRAAYVDPGSVNLGGYDADGLPGGEYSIVYDNSFHDIRWKFEQCQRLQLGPSMAIFEPGFLRVALAYERQGHMPPGAFAKLYFGQYLTFGLPPTAGALHAYLDMLEGSQLPWAVAVLGGDVFKTGIAQLALEAGGHLRVGLEDHAGMDQPSNLELLREAISLCEKVGRPLATRTETAAILNLPQ